MSHRPRRRHPALVALVAVLLGVVVFLLLWQPSSSDEPTLPPPTSPARTGPAPSSPTPSSSPPVPGSGNADSVLARLPVKGRAAGTGYDRAAFGTGWLDTDHNGCDTRNDILRRDLRSLRFGDDAPPCLVEAGILDDPYSGGTLNFVRGIDTSYLVQIDHVVALSNAWQTGAQYWPAAKRIRFANDPLELLAVDGRLNEQKGAGGAATWLPPNKAYRCAYVARQVAVKAKYGLWVSPPEHDAIARILARCPGQRTPGN